MTKKPTPSKASFRVPKRKGGRPVTGAASDADRKRISHASGNIVHRRQCEDQKRRDRLELNDEKWLKWYCLDDYWLPFEKPHRAIIAGAREAMERGSDMVVAAERGIGKSAILYGIVIKLALTREQSFPVYIPFGEKDKQQGFAFWVDCLVNNDRIDADYPEFTAPFRHANGISQRIRTTTWDDTGSITGAKVLTGKGVIAFPDRLGVIGSSTMGGNPRGMNHKIPGSRTLRPTMAFIDDVQSDDIAYSQGVNGGVFKTIRTVNGAIRGLKRAGAGFSILMAGTCICTGDVMSRFLNKAGWTSVLVPCIESWPTGWDDPKSDCRQHWEDWGDMFLSRDGSESAYFRKNRAVMSDGIKLNSPKAYWQHVKSKEEGELQKGPPAINATHAVMREYFTMGHEAFMAERQQQPVDAIAESQPWTLKDTTIMSRTTKRQTWGRPEWAVSVVASTDVNPSYALSTALTGYGQDQSAAVLWYGVHKCAIKGDNTRPGFDAELFAELVAHGRELAGQPVRPDVWAIDAGGANFDAVIQFADQSVQLCGIQAHAYTGRGGKNYKEYGRTYPKGQPRREMCHFRRDIKNGRHIKWIVWSSDHWREVSQRAWLGEIGAPGACSLPHGQHGQFAIQASAQRIIKKGKGLSGEIEWIWLADNLCGKHDFGDVMAQSYACAAFGGIGTGGGSSRKKAAPRRKCAVAMSENPA